MSESDDGDRGTLDGVSIHAAACLSLVVFGIANAVSGGWEVWTTGVDFAAAGSLGGGVVVAVCGTLAFVGDSDEFDSLLGVVTVVGVAIYVGGVVWGLVV